MTWLSMLMILLLIGNMLSIRLWNNRMLPPLYAHGNSVPVGGSNVPHDVLNLGELKSLRIYQQNPDCTDIAAVVDCNLYTTYKLTDRYAGNILSADRINNLNNAVEGKLADNNRQQQTQKINQQPELYDNTDIKRYLPMLPKAYYNDFYQDLIGGVAQDLVKRNKIRSPANCDCKIENDLLDLGADHFPRFLVNAICQTENAANEFELKCPQGTYCRKLEYKVKVLTFRMENLPNDNTLLWLPDDLRHLWKFKTVTVAAGCFCGP